MKTLSFDEAIKIINHGERGLQVQVAEGHTVYVWSAGDVRTSYAFIDLAERKGWPISEVPD